MPLPIKFTDLNVPVEPLIQAAIGGFVLNMMNLYQQSKLPKADRVPRDSLYWVFFVFWPIAGMLLAYIYLASGYTINGWLALTTGLTAPTPIQTIIDKGTASSIPISEENDIEEA